MEQRLSARGPRDLLIGVLKLYKLLLSPYFGNCCRFHPSCSEYMMGSVRLNGVILGSLDGAWRILRCNPFHPGGIDEPQRIRFFVKEG
jgi:putative membrane protein insertion efficiency factor